MVNDMSLALYCCGCLGEVQAVQCTGAEIYPHRLDLADKVLWQCPACKNYVGCHPGGSVALGNIPTPELRAARSHVHAILDPIWKGGRMRRGQLYARISAKIGKPYHTGEIKSVFDARVVYRVLKSIVAELDAAEAAATTSV